MIVDFSSDLREDKSVSIQPMWVLWVEGHEFVEQDMSDRGQAHGGAWVAGVRCEGGIDLRKASCISRRSRIG
jgi:hypothetical protein